MKVQKGFTAIEGLLILIIVGILGGTGWYVYNAHNKTADTFNNADQANSSVVKYTKKAKPAVDPTADWTSYSSKDGQYSLKYPKTWATAAHPELCSAGLLLLGADAKSVGACASENAGQVEVVSISGDSSKDAELKTGYVSITKTSVTVGTVVGVKMVGTASGQVTSGAPGALADGTKVTKYIFYTNSHTYTATYVQLASYPNALSDFNLMVTKTLNFSA